MVIITPYPKIFCMRHQAFITATSQIQSEHFHNLRQSRKLIARKSKIMMQQVHATHFRKVCKKELITPTFPMQSRAVVSAFPYEEGFNYPITMNDYSSFHTPMLTAGHVLVYFPTTSPIWGQVGTVAKPLLSPTLSHSFVQENVYNLSNYTYEFTYSAEQFGVVEEITNEESYNIQEEIIAQSNTSMLNTVNTNSHVEVQSIETDPIEYYLKLPKEFFPSPRMLTVDPNPMIDEFCKMTNLQFHLPWLLDLEFGIPKSPITRAIPMYDVKFNSIHCKNAPNAIHPGFESCPPEFKRVLLFYYDCIVSAWYRGYMIIHCDRSVENFQSWLLLPMQVLGIGWP